MALEGFGAVPTRVMPRCFCFSLFCFLAGATSASFGFFFGLLDGVGGDEDVVPTFVDDGAEIFWSRARCDSVTR